MPWNMRLPGAAVALAVLGIAIACGGKSSGAGTPAGPSNPNPGGPSAPPTYDVDALGVPQFATNDYIDLAAIQRISRFRSSIGHSTSDDFETCRSMKHYFQPKGSADWSTVTILAPAQGSGSGRTSGARRCRTLPWA
jgi:hypothetical protein